MTDDARMPAASEAGILTPEQKDLVLRHLPVDVSFMDERHSLLYWRGPTFEDCEDEYIGRHIDDCHNATSRAAIAKLIAAFTAGTRDEAVFWDVEDGHQKVTRYTAVRDADGVYRGMMETIVDVTALEGFTGRGNTVDW